MKKKLILLIGILVVLFLTSCTINENQITEDNQIENNFEKGYSTYTDGIFGFSVTFPSTWASETYAYIYGSENENPSPDSGINIYIDGNKENFIYVYETYGKQTDKFVKDSGYKKEDIDKNIVLYEKENGDIIEVQAFINENDHISANIKMDIKTYNLYKSEIIKLLKSIKWTQKGQTPMRP